MKRGHYDVLILGGGPAGSAAAIELARGGVAVAVLERSNYEGSRIGEMLPPEASPLLRALGVWESFQRDEHLAAPGIVFAWTTNDPQETDFIFNPFGNGWQLDRTRFDAMLASAAEEAGATVLRGVRAQQCRRSTGGSWQVPLLHHPVHAVSGSFLIDATGRSAWPTRRQGVRRIAMDRLVGVVGHLQQTRRNDQRLLLEAFAHGWWYSATLPGDRTIAACMTDADYLPHGRDELRRFWDDCLRQAPLTAEAIGAVQTLGDLQTVSANTARMEVVHGPGWIAVGDAAASYDPLSSRGISKALESGLRAAQAVARWVRDRHDTLPDYAAWFEEDFDSYQRHYRHFYGRVTRWPDSQFWQRRAAAS